MPYNWLHDIPGCRVIGGMEVQAKDFCSEPSLGSIARLLLNKILSLLRAGEDKSDGGKSVETYANGSPLVVVSHGLAGIVVKQVGYTQHFPDNGLAMYGADFIIGYVDSVGRASVLFTYCSTSLPLCMCPKNPRYILLFFFFF